MERISDAELAVQIRKGRREAWSELYSRYWPRVYRFAAKLTGNPDSAEDICQDAFLKARDAIQGLVKAESLRSWLFSIVRNEINAHFRRFRGNGAIDREMLAAAETPHDLIEQDEIVGLVSQAVEALKPEYRAVILLREYEQLSYREIAEATGDTESSVKSRLFKARRALLKQLRPVFGRKEQ